MHSEGDTVIERVYTPKFLVIDSVEGLDEALQAEGIEFPVMVKTVVASGSLAAHQMAIIFTLEQLKGYGQFPAFIQEYFNHKGTIHKCSVIGAFIHTDKRASTRDFDLQKKPDPVIFNSQAMKDITDSLSYQEQANLPEDDAMHIALHLSHSLVRSQDTSHVYSSSTGLTFVWVRRDPVHEAQQTRRHRCQLLPQLLLRP
jgi:hypothetical protein